MANVSKKRLIRLFNRLAYTVLIFAGLVVFAALTFATLTDYSLFDSFYWSIVTAFTVGYGDVLPATMAAKVLTMILIPASAITYLFVGAHIVGDVLDDRNKFTDEEQDWNAEMLNSIADHLGIDHRSCPDSHK